MAAPVEEEAEYECVIWSPLSFDTRLTMSDSYEGLPPNFSLSANMAAGAFAGIAVSVSDSIIEATAADIRLRSTQLCIQ